MGVTTGVTAGLAITAALAVYVEYKSRKIGFDPAARALPDLPVLEKNELLSGVIDRVGEGDLMGPESLVVANGYLFTGLADGRIVRFVDSSNYTTVARSCEVEACPPLQQCAASPTDVARSEKQCGRPLGMRLVADTAGDALIVADAYMGLLRMTDIYSGMPKLTRLSGGFKLLNDVAVGERGEYFMTETTTQYRRRRIFWAAWEMRPTGRLLSYADGKVRVLLDKVYIPNGLEYDAETKSLLFVSGVSVRRFNMYSGEISTFVPVLPGTGDNIRAMHHLPTGEPRQCYWLGLGSKYAQPFSLLKVFDTNPLARKIVAALVPYRFLVELVPKSTLLAVYDAVGRLIATYQDPTGRAAPWLSEVTIYDGFLYLGSWYNPFLARVKIESLARASQLEQERVAAQPTD